MDYPNPLSNQIRRVRYFSTEPCIFCKIGIFSKVFLKSTIQMSPLLQCSCILLLSPYLSVLSNRPVTFLTKSSWISVLRPDSLLTFCPYNYSAPQLYLLSIARIFFLPGGLLRFILCLRNPGLLNNSLNFWMINRPGPLT